MVLYGIDLAYWAHSSIQRYITPAYFTINKYKRKMFK